MLATLDRLTDTEITVPDGTTPADLRVFYGTWQAELSALTEVLVAQQQTPGSSARPLDCLLFVPLDKTRVELLRW